MFRKRQCETPATSPVATLARFTVADALAGLIPLLSKMRRRRRAEAHPERAVDEGGEEPRQADDDQVVHAAKP